MSQSPLVSCIIIFFNAEKYFEEAIASVFAQTYNHWELILADDGSTDSSTAIAQRYAQQYPDRVRYCQHENHENHGMSATRNLGIRQAQGDYIAFLDADDVWLPLKLEQQVGLLTAHPDAMMVCGRSQYWHSWTGEAEDRDRDFISELSVPPNAVYPPPTLLIQNHPLGKVGAPCPSNLLVRREMVEHVGGFEEQFCGVYQQYEDQGFLAKVYLHAPIYVSDRCWDKYRLHPDSCTSGVRKAKKYHLARQFFLEWLQSYLVSQQVTDPQIWEALDRSLWPYRYPVLSRFIQLPQRIKRKLTALKA